MINITNDLRVDADKLQYILQQHTTPKTTGGKGSWRSIGFYPTFNLLAQGVAQSAAFELVKSNESLALGNLFEAMKGFIDQAELTLTEKALKRLEIES